MLADAGADTTHLSYERVAAYVDRELQHGDLQNVQKHLSHCAECQERVQKLVAFREEITAVKDGEKVTSPAPPAPQARFKVLEQEKVEELKRARENYAGMHLLLGSLYAQVGLLDAAEREFQALLAANPGSQVAQDLLRNVRSLRPK